MTTTPAPQPDATPTPTIADNLDAIWAAGLNDLENRDDPEAVMSDITDATPTPGLSETKTCSRCGVCQLLVNFYRNKLTSDGRRSNCKTCHDVDVQNRRESNREATRNRDRNYRHRNAERTAETNRRYRKNHPEIAARPKRPAHQQVQNAVRGGVLAVPPTCSDCGRTAKLDAHHDDYAKPLDVRWLCRRCHANVHRRTA